ncbi:MAG TPA: L,D-transpeptidase family protein [Actinomycetota bacterium]|nr:L,D-transpeptidase family protein [Actinomycetota bacterium]
MSHRARAAATFVATAFVAGAWMAPAAAQDAPGITLKAGRRVIEFGQEVLLSGRIDPPSEGETVSIVDGTGRERATATTDADGKYRVRLSPRRTAQLQARWVALLSEPVTVKVLPRVRISLKAVRLFGKARISGTVAPPQDAGRVAVALRRGGKQLWQRKLTLRDGRRFATTFEVGKPGRFVAGAAFTDAAGATGRDRSSPKATPLPVLDEGSRGIYVRLLESRLCELAYYMGGCDRRYTDRTADAVRAFNKIERRERLGTVDATTWQALANARRATPRYRSKGFHIEVDQTRQVLMMVKDRKVTAVLHVSTGAPSTPTYDGTWHVNRKLAGYSPNRLYYPSYFDGNRALHGWPEVPTYNASHGCVRLPMWSATWVYGKADMGTEIRIYH